MTTATFGDRSMLAKGGNVPQRALTPRFGPATPFKLTVQKVTLPTKPLPPQSRGLIVSQDFYLESNAIIGGGWNPQLVRTWLLFWDRLILPTNRMISPMLDQDMAFLAREGILDQVRVEFTGSGVIGGDVMMDSQLAAYRGLDAREPGAWAIASGPGTMQFPARDVEVDRGLLVKLTDAIPVPAGDVPLDDVLEFRERRTAERLALRAHLEDVYQRIVVAGDRDLAGLTEFDRLDRAIADHVRTSSESGLKLRLTSLEGKFTVKTVGAGLAAGEGALKVGMPMTTAALVGLGTTLAGAFGGLGLTVGLKGGASSGSPFQYITSIRNELPFINDG